MSGLRKTNLQNSLINALQEKQLPCNEREIREYSIGQCKRKIIEVKGSFWW